MRLYLIYSYIENERLLELFLHHYSLQGIEYSICLNYSQEKIPTIIPTTTIIRNAELPFNVLQSTTILNDLIEEYLSDDDWYVIADIDEFGFIREIPKNRDHVRGYLVDCFTQNYSLPVELEENLWEQFPRSERYTATIGGCDSKVVMASKKVKILPGHHTCESGNFDKEQLIPVYHFKWHGNVIKRLEERLKLNPPWKDELEKQIEKFRY